MLAIKTALAVVGVFIVLATGFIAVEIYHRLSASRSGADSQTDAGQASVIDLPAGSEILSMTAVGGYVALLIRQGEGTGVYVFDPQSRRIVAIISALPPTSETIQP